MATVSTHTSFWPLFLISIVAVTTNINPNIADTLTTTSQTYSRDDCCREQAIITSLLIKITSTLIRDTRRTI